MTRPSLPSNRHPVIATFDEDTISVYLAYKPEIAKWAIENHKLAGPHFSLNRMSWIKPGFQWMMYSSGWVSEAGGHKKRDRSLSRRSGFEGHSSTNS